MKKVYSFNVFPKVLEEKYGKCLQRGADIYVCRNTVPELVPYNKCILLLAEPPLSSHRKHLYKNRSKFHTVYTFTPGGKNMFLFPGQPHVYPYNPVLSEDIPRENTTIRTRGIYYAGWKSKGFTTAFGNAVNLYPARTRIGEFLKANYKESYIYGKGWGKESKVYPIPGGRKFKPISWRLQKKMDMEKHNCDFVLCIENTHMPNYISEKIHDGFASDRVVLYLGASNIGKFVPPNCFVNLNPHLNKNNGAFDPSVILNIIQNMTQEQYDLILKNARSFRKTLAGKWKQANRQLCEHIIKRIGN